MKNLKIAGVALAVLAAAAYGACWMVRADDAKIRKSAMEKSIALMKALKNDRDAVVPMLEKYSTEKEWRVRVGKPTGFLPRFSRELSFPAEETADLLVDSLVRFVGGGHPDEDGKARIRSLVAFAGKYLPDCPASARDDVRVRLLDAFFVLDDFDTAVKIIDEGLPGRTANWCKATAAKIRAHQAESAGDDAEALKQFLAFGEALAADADSGMPECDPSTGVSYSRAWLLAKNALRCSNYMKKLGRDEDSRAKFEEATRLYAQALEDTRDDELSLAALKDEMSAGSVPPPDSPQGD